MQLFLKRFLFVTFILSVSSCSYFIDNFLDKSYDVVNLKGKNLGLVFSHNVNGETHPCGCRHFPLGGLPQIAGAISKLEKTETVVYVDSGDTLFAAANIPKTLEKSQTYNAEQLAQGLAKVGLKYWVPGDQDFAKGTKFIKKIVEKTGVHLILSNLAKSDELPHKELVLFEEGPHKIFVLGFINPQVLPSRYKILFNDLETSFKQSLVKLKEKGYDEKSPFHRLVVVSHSGIGPDTNLAKSYPMIDWIVGAHTMNFLRFPQEEGKTKIVQVLSRNHYLGHITFSLKKDKTNDKYEIIEIRDELKDELKPNPYLAFIDKHKEELAKVQKKEQSEMLESNLGLIRYSTNSSCIECHDSQNKFWQGTAHALAYQTLITAKEQNNLSCVKCHSLGLGEKKGFGRVQDILEFDETLHGKVLDKERTEMTEKYWRELQESFGPVKSVRQLKPENRRKLASKWAALDQKNHVNRNFANVQCLNCHIQHDNHPFENFDPPMMNDQVVAKMKDKCLTCHDPDQSPEWYQKQENGLPGAVDQEVVGKNFKKMSCPKVSK
jgi:2',3'-cyclic-nucleotide 2'-phosphodiesterase (5'-nucleotidase family)